MRWRNGASQELGLISMGCKCRHRFGGTSCNAKTSKSFAPKWEQVAGDLFPIRSRKCHAKVKQFLQNTVAAQRWIFISHSWLMRQCNCYLWRSPKFTKIFPSIIQPKPCFHFEIFSISWSSFESTRNEEKMSWKKIVISLKTSRETNVQVASEKKLNWKPIDE